MKLMVFIWLQTSTTPHQMNILLIQIFGNYVRCLEPSVEIAIKANFGIFEGSTSDKINPFFTVLYCVCSPHAACVAALLDSWAPQWEYFTACASENWSMSMSKLIFVKWSCDAWIGKMHSSDAVVKSFI